VNIEIRPYHPDDSPAVMQVWEEANCLAHPFLSESFVAKIRLDIPSLYLPNSDTWIARYSDEKKGCTIVGFLSLIGNEVGAIFVLPAYHGKGVGWQLMDKAKSIHEKLEVEVFKNNQLARRFYSKYGFKKMKETFHEPSGQPIFRLMYEKIDERLEGEGLPA